MAILSQRVLYHIRSDGGRGEGVQHRRKFYPRSDMEKFPKTQSRTRLPRLRFPPIRFSRNGKETALR